jgi:hypothetical protein
MMSVMLKMLQNPWTGKKSWENALVVNQHVVDLAEVVTGVIAMIEVIVVAVETDLTEEEEVVLTNITQVVADEVNFA